MLAQRKFIGVFEEKWNSDCLYSRSIVEAQDWMKKSGSQLNGKEDILVSKNPNNAQMSIPGEQSGDKIHQADKISQQEAENRQTLSWPSPFWW